MVVVVVVTVGQTDCVKVDTLVTVDSIVAEMVLVAVLTETVVAVNVAVMMDV